MAHFERYTFVFACDFKEESVSAAKAFAFAEMRMQLKMVFINTPADAFKYRRCLHTNFKVFIFNVRLEVDIYNDYTVEKGILIMLKV